LTSDLSEFFERVGWIGGERLVNPFDEADDPFLVLANNQQELSLWPAYLRVPAGWTVVTGPDSRQACLDRIERPENFGPGRTLGGSVRPDVRPDVARDDLGEARSSRAQQE
jgi:MbtH protein